MVGQDSSVYASCLYSGTLFGIYHFGNYSAASAGPGGLGSNSSVNATVDLGPDDIFSGNEVISSKATMKNMSITLSGSGDTGILTALNLDLEGTFFALEGRADAKITVSVSYPGRAVQQCFGGPPGSAESFCIYGPAPKDVFNGYYSLNSSGAISGSGLMAPYVPGAENLIKTPSFFVNRGEIVLVDLSLETSAYCVAGTLVAGVTGGNWCTAGAVFTDTFSFAQNGPVFDLPTGWAANSLDGSIVNNLLAVPEPSTLALSAMPLLGMAAVRRRRRKLPRQVHSPKLDSPVAISLDR